MARVHDVKLWLVISKTLFSRLSESIKLFFDKAYQSHFVFYHITGVYREGVNLAAAYIVSDVKIRLQTLADVVHCKFGKNKILFVFFVLTKTTPGHETRRTRGVACRNGGLKHPRLKEKACCHLLCSTR